MSSRLQWVTIGSDPACDIQVQGLDVAPQHVRAAFNAKGQLIVQDLGSGKPVGKNSPSASFTAESFQRSDKLYLGTLEIKAADIYAHFEVASPLATPTVPPATSAPSVEPGSKTAPAQTLSVPIPTSVGGILSYDLPDGVSVIGRDPTSHIHLDHPMVSLQHAVILRNGEVFKIRDAGSTHGTFLDGAPVGKNLQPLHPGQVVGIAGFRLVVRPAAVGAGMPAWVAEAAPRATSGDLFVSSFQTGVEIRANALVNREGKRSRAVITLEGVRLWIPPGRLVALMGPSGSGKTTLLRMLAGQAPPYSGSVSFNDDNLYRGYNELRSIIGYVPQEEIMHTQLTVRQALFFASRLRLPADFSDKELNRCITEILDQLGILAQQHLRIGSAEQRGISGGQKKRVNLAMELIPNPAVLFLDEPTSGLASTDSERVIAALRDLSRKQGKTVIVTIHTPPPHVFRQFDLLAVVDNHTIRVSPPPPFQPGRLIYFGPAAEAALFFQKLDPTDESRKYEGADAVLEALERNPRKATADWQRAFESSPIYQRFVEKPLSTRPSSSIGSSHRHTLPGRLRQFITLCWRLWLIKLNDKVEIRNLVVQPLLIGFLIFLMTRWISDFHGPGEPEPLMRIVSAAGKCLFLAAITALWLGCNNSVREIVGEAAIYSRERAFGLPISAYLSSKLAVLAAIGGAQTLLLLLAIHPFVNLKANFLQVWLVLWLTSVVGASLGLFMSATARTTQQAIQLVPLVLLPMIIFGGGVTHLAEFSDTTKPLAELIPARWAFESLLLLEDHGRSTAAAPSDLAKTYFPITLIERLIVGSTDYVLSSHLALALAVMICMALLFIGGAAWQLKRKDIR